MEDNNKENDTREDENTTYSWVNPKLQKDHKPEDGNNPWDGREGQNYWHYDAKSQPDANQQPYNAQPGYNAGSGSNGYGWNPEPQHAQGGDDPKKPGKSGRGRKWGTVVAMAVVFGLVAGTVTYGVYGIENRIHPIQNASAGSAESSSEEESVSASSTSEQGGEAVLGGSAAVQGSSAENGADLSETSDGNGRILSVEEVAAQSMPALVTISTMSVQEMQDFFGGTQEYQVEGAGTGVIIGENDTELLIATNNHVVEGAEQLSVGFVDESAISGNIKGTDADADLAVVSVKLSDLPDSTASAIRVASIGDSNALALGEQVVAIGNALGYGQSVTSGYVSGLNRSLELQDGSSTFVSDGLIQTDAAINSGNSGGALLNMRGELVGINEAKSSSSSSGANVDNIGYAIPMAKAQPILEKMMNAQTREVVDSADQGALGVTLTDVTSEYAQMYHMPEGVCFTSVLKGGPADAAGAKKGDVLTRFDGRKVSNYRNLEQILQYYKSGETVDIVVERAGAKGYTEKTLTITLGDRKILDSMKDTGTQGNVGTDPEEQDGSMNENDLFGRLFGGN